MIELSTALSVMTTIWIMIIYKKNFDTKYMQSIP